jgi:hypothetical protein
MREKWTFEKISYNFNYKIIAGGELSIWAGGYNIALECMRNFNLQT